MLRLALLCLVLASVSAGVFAVVPAAAQERRMLDADEAAAFRGVGRLNIAGRRFCSASLITPTIVVTAAHCLYHPRSRARVPLSEMRFVAGLRLGKVAALRRPVRAVTTEAFVFNGTPDVANVGADLALLELDAPVEAEAAEPLTPGLLAPGDEVSIVSYARDRAQAPSRVGPCPPLAAIGPVLALDCAVTYGISGAPVLASDGTGAPPRVVAIVSAMGSTIGEVHPVALAARLEPELETLRAALAAAPIEPRPEGG